MSELSEYLGITEEQLDELDPEFHEDSGSSGDMVYSFYFNVPEGASEEVLEATGWKVGDLINDIPTSLFDDCED